MDIQTLLPFPKSITEESNSTNLKGLVAAIDASCLIHKAILFIITVRAGFWT